MRGSRAHRTLLPFLNGGSRDENRMTTEQASPIVAPARHRARVAQLDRASASGAEGCGFDPRRAHQLHGYERVGIAFKFDEVSNSGLRCVIEL